MTEETDTAGATDPLSVDHAFLIVPPAEFEPACAALAAAGLSLSCRGGHPGQGTENAFFCFDNAFIEILCVAHPGETERAPVSRIGFKARAAWRSSGAAPIGIGLRGTRPDAALPFDTWLYAPPGSSSLKPTLAAVDSDDLRQPFVFRGQRVAPPSAWTDGRAAERQRAGGFAEITGWRLAYPPGLEPAHALRVLAETGVLELGASADVLRLEIRFSRSDGGPERTITWPGLQWRDG